MAIIKAFRALRPDESHAKQVSCVPYDVVYESEVRKFIASNSLSFLRVTRAEGEFPEDSKPLVEEVFARAKQNLDWFISENIYAADPEEAFYVYQLATDSHARGGGDGDFPLRHLLFEQRVHAKGASEIEERTRLVGSEAAPFAEFADARAANLPPEFLVLEL